MRFSHLISMIVVAAAFCGMGWALAQESEQPQVQPAPETYDDSAAALGSSFTYQGYLEQGSVPYNGICDFQFSLWDALSVGVQLGSTQTASNIALSGGRFTATLNNLNQFGNLAFNGQARWLGIAARCPAGSGAYTTLTPRQPLHGTPYALGLRPGTVISGSLPSTGVLVLDNESDTGFSLLSNNGGIHISSAGDGFHVDSAIDEGVQVNSAGDNGLFIGSAGDHGIEVDVASLDGVNVGWAGDDGFGVGSAIDDGFRVDWAVGDGFSVGSAGGHGINVNSADGDGLHICATGFETTCSTDSSSHGVEVGNAEGSGIYVASAGGAGIYVLSPVGHGISVISAGAYAGWFNGNINVNGTCGGCLLSALGINAGDRPLRPGDVVAIQNMVASDLDNAPQLWQVVPAAPGLTAVGVVAGRAELVIDEEMLDAGQSGRSLVPREGEASPGDYVNIITYGPFQVRVAFQGAPVSAGAYLLPASDGLARPMDLETATAADLLTTIGIALSEPDAEGLVWVLINGR